MQTISKINLDQPESLNIGELYLFLERDVEGVRAVAFVVTFQSYDPCPAFVIIQTSEGSRIRCLREDIFELRDGYRINDLEQFSSHLHQKNNLYDPPQNRLVNQEQQGEVRFELNQNKKNYRTVSNLIILLSPNKKLHPR